MFSDLAVSAEILTFPTRGLRETIGSRFGGIPTGLPHVSLPQFRPELIIPITPMRFRSAIPMSITLLTPGTTSLAISRIGEPTLRGMSGASAAYPRVAKSCILSDHTFEPIPNPFKRLDINSPPYTSTTNG